MGAAEQNTDRPAARGVLLAACVSALVVNANTSAVTILLPSISEDVGSPARAVLDRRRDRGGVHPRGAAQRRGVARPRPVALDRLGRHGAGGGRARPDRARAQQGRRLGLDAAATLGCLALGIAGAIAFVRVEKRVEAPLVDLQLLRNRVLVGATLAILIVAGTINGLMYVVSIYFQDPAALDLSAFEAGLATLPAAAGMIAITPAITPLAAKLGGATAVGLGFAIAAAGFAVLAFVQASWAYAAFVGPLVALAVGLGIANGPASSGSTATVSADQVGAASGISNMARYVGAAVAVAAVAMVNEAVITNRREAGESAADALAAGLSSSALLMAILAGSGVLLILLMRRHRPAKAQAVDRAAAAAITTHTIPTRPSPAS